VYSQGIGPCIVPFQPCDRLRVSPHPASSGCAGDGFLEFPRAPHPSALQVAKSPGFPASSTLLPRLSMQSSGLPESRIFRLFRRWFFEFPRIAHPSAQPSSKLRVSPALRLKPRLPMIPRVSPVPRSSGCAGDGSSSFLESRILQRYRRREAPGSPESSLLQHRLSMSLRVSPDSASSGCADGELPGIPGSRSIGCAAWWISGSPRYRTLRLLRLCVLKRP